MARKHERAAVKSLRQTARHLNDAARALAFLDWVTSGLVGMLRREAPTEPSDPAPKKRLAAKRAAGER